MHKDSLHRFILFIICVCVAASTTQASNGDKEKLKKEEVQLIVRRNTANQVKKETKKEKPAVKANASSSREDRIRAMGPNALTVIKRNTEMKIKQFQTKINKTKQLTDKEKEFKVHLLNMFIEELTESERDMIEAQEALRKSLLTDFRDAGVLRENSKKRLEALRIATLKEEQSYNRIISIEEALKSYEEHGNESMSLMDEFLKEIANAADQLESDIEQKILPDDNAVVDGSHIEAVVHLKEGEENIQQARNTAVESGKQNVYDERLDMLVDSQNNKYILTRPKDTTSPNIDHYLVLDIIIIFVVSFPLGLICNLVGVPSMFGYIMAGLMLGPSGLNAIQAIVQVETFGEYGVFLIMFFAGLEFSVEKIQKVWKVAVQASLLISVCMTLCGLFIGSLLNYNIPKGESAFVAACMSMSSTPLVVRFLQGTGTHESLDYATLLLGMLVMQDVQLGIIVAALPAFAPMVNSNNALIYTTVMLLKTIGSLGIILLFVFLLTKYFLPSYLKYIGMQSKEILFLGSLTLMFVFQLSTNYIGISMELGCFLAGLVISISDFQQVVEKAVLPVHDFFATLFFATVGFHVFPKFVAVELTYLIFLTAVVIGGKYLVSFLILHWILPKNKQHMKWLVSGGLAQVSEFSFVLASRARHLKIVTREVFLLILSITTLSFVFAPAIWKLSVWKFKRTSYTS